VNKKELRACFGCFATGVVIACAKKKNFFNQTFFSKSLIKKDDFLKKFEEFWAEFSNKNYLGKKIAVKLRRELDKKFDGSFLQKKLKQIFADEFFGITINSFSSVSLDPPIIQFSIDNKSSNLSLFRKNRYFSLNILSSDQQNLSNAFATPKNNAKWQVEPFIFGKYGNPIFKNSLVFIECKKHKVIKIGDHHVIFGEVLDYGLISEKDPLIYYRSKYNALSLSLS